MSEETLKFRVQFTLEMHSRQLHILHIGYRRIKNPFTYYGWAKKLEQILSSPSITHQATLETMTAIARLFCSNSSLIFRCHQDVHCYKMCWMLLGAVSKRNGFCTLLDGRRAPFWLSSTYTFPNSNFFYSCLNYQKWNLTNIRNSGPDFSHDLLLCAKLRKHF